MSTSIKRTWDAGHDVGDSEIGEEPPETSGQASKRRKEAPTNDYKGVWDLAPWLHSASAYRQVTPAGERSLLVSVPRALDSLPSPTPSSSPHSIPVPFLSRLGTVNSLTADSAEQSMQKHPGVNNSKRSSQLPKTLLSHKLWQPLGKENFRRQKTSKLKMQSKHTAS